MLEELFSRTNFATALTPSKASRGTRQRSELDRSGGTVKRFVAKAKRELSTKERAAVASELFESLDCPGEAVSADEAADAWGAEAVRRADRVMRGEATGIPAEKVHADILRKLRAKR